MTRKSHRAKMLDITPKVRKAVYKRDNGLCVTCGAWCELGHSNSHYIARNDMLGGGLGIEQNIVTQCMECHRLMDFGEGKERKEIKLKVKEYLSACYDDWNEDDLRYKWGSRYK